MSPANTLLCKLIFSTIIVLRKMFLGARIHLSWATKLRDATFSAVLIAIEVLIANIRQDVVTNTIIMS